MKKKTIRGKAYVLGDHVDTDQILSAEHLQINPADPQGYVQLGRLAMCGLPEDAAPFVDAATGKSPYSIVVAGENFGCGSSREHAVVALGATGIEAVLAQSYARIFFRNCVSTGEVLPVTTATRLCDTIRTGDTVEIDVEQGMVRVAARGLQAQTEPSGELADIITAGGLFAYARASGKMPSAA